MDEQKPTYARRQVIVDRQFQMSFLKLWLVVGLGLVLMSAVSYFFVSRFLGRRSHDPIVVNVMIGMSVFIILFCILMGILSMILAHRVAGAAYRLEKSIDKMLEGDYTQRIALRPGDYLTRLADRLNLLQDKLRDRDASEVLKRLQDFESAAASRLTDSDRALLAAMREKIQPMQKSPGPV